MLRIFTFLLLLSFLRLHHASAQVWFHQPDQQWNEAWENKYAMWFEKTVDTTWLQKPSSPFYNKSVDCAEFAYLTRLYFSYENHLEFAIIDPKNKTKKISSLSNNWDRYPVGTARLQAFTNDLISQVGTSTIPQDSVLIPLKPEFIKPGVLVAGDQKRGHTWVIQKINPSGIPQLIYATLPHSSYLYQSFVFPPSQSAFPSGALPSNSSAGLRRFKWPADLFKKAEQISYFSQDQNDLKIVKYSSFFEDIQNVIRKKPKTADEEIGYLMDDLCMKVRVRVNIIIDAGQALVKNQGRPFSEKEKDLYSTDKRDQDIILTIRRLDQYYSQSTAGLSDKNVQRYKNILNPQWTTADECLVNWANNRTEPLGAIRQKFLSGFISSDASAGFSRRWGEF